MARQKYPAYIAFLDIDGVLTSPRVQIANQPEGPAVGTIRFDPVAIEYLNSLHDRFDIQFVITSEWARHIEPLDKKSHLWIQAAFASAGFRGVIPSNHTWKVNFDGADARKRDEHIIEYVRDQNEYRAEDGKESVQGWIIFDDSDFGFPEEIFVKTCSYDGLRFSDIQKAETIVSTWKRK